MVPLFTLAAVSTAGLGSWLCEFDWLLGLQTNMKRSRLSNTIRYASIERICSIPGMSCSILGNITLTSICLVEKENRYDLSTHDGQKWIQFLIHWILMRQQISAGSKLSILYLTSPQKLWFVTICQTLRRQMQIPKCGTGAPLFLI